MAAAASNFCEYYEPFHIVRIFLQFGIKAGASGEQMRGIALALLSALPPQRVLHAESKQEGSLHQRAEPGAGLRRRRAAYRRRRRAALRAERGAAEGAPHCGQSALQRAVQPEQDGAAVGLPCRQSGASDVQSAAKCTESGAADGAPPCGHGAVDPGGLQRAALPEHDGTEVGPLGRQHGASSAQPVQPEASVLHDEQRSGQPAGAQPSRPDAEVPQSADHTDAASEVSSDDYDATSESGPGQRGALQSDPDPRHDAASEVSSDDYDATSESGPGKRVALHGDPDPRQNAYSQAVREAQLVCQQRVEANMLLARQRAAAASVRQRESLHRAFNEISRNHRENCDRMLRNLSNDFSLHS